MSNFENSFVAKTRPHTPNIQKHRQKCHYNRSAPKLQGALLVEQLSGETLCEQLTDANFTAIFTRKFIVSRSQPCMCVSLWSRSAKSAPCRFEGLLLQQLAYAAVLVFFWLASVLLVCICVWHDFFSLQHIQWVSVRFDAAYFFVCTEIPFV